MIFESKLFLRKQKDTNTGGEVHQLFSFRNLIYPKEKHIWAQIRIIHETEKAILVDNGRKFWIPKSRINKIKLKNNTLEIYTSERTIG